MYAYCIYIYISIFISAHEINNSCLHSCNSHYSHHQKHPLLKMCPVYNHQRLKRLTCCPFTGADQIDQKKSMDAVCSNDLLKYGCSGE